VLVGVAGLVAGPLAWLVLTVTPAGAAGPGCQAGDIEVTNNNDIGAGSLPTAFTTASFLTGPQTICVDSTVTGPITLTSELGYSAGFSPSLTVLGNGITISGNNASRVIANTTSGPLTLDDVTITAGKASGSGGGVSSGGDVTVIDSTISDNHLPNSGSTGGGISSLGAVTVTNSTISGNTSGNGAPGTDADAGGIYSQGAVTVTNSTISDNTANATNLGGGGGILDFTAAAVTITNSTISHNSAPGVLTDGGGLISHGAVSVTNSTISGNTTSGGGGGIATSLNLTVNNSTISGNTAPLGGGGIATNGNVTLAYATVVQNSAVFAAANVDTAPGSLTSFGSVVAQPAGGAANCSVTSTTSHGFNDEDDAAATCGFSTATQDLAPGTAPNLGPLANNGGPTQTQLPQDGPSPLIDAIPAGSCQADGAAAITTDQRGLPRPDAASPNCDIGAVEVQLPAPTVVTAAFTG